MTYSKFGCDGELFLRQGRPNFPFRGCAILCITTYRVSNSGEELSTSTVKRSSPRLFPLRHAEELVFNEIIVTENKFKSKAVKVELYSSYSPCIKCCYLIEKFLYRRPGCKISIAFTCVYLHDYQQHCSALRRLSKNKSVIRLDVFGEKEWEVLQDEELVALTPEQQGKMREYDEYWRNILDNIVGQRRFSVVETMSLFESLHEAIQSDDAELKTDGVQAFQRSISAYQEAGVPSQAKLEEMDKRVREAIRRRDREDRLLYVALASVLMFVAWFLVTKLVF